MSLVASKVCAINAAAHICMGSLHTDCSQSPQPLQYTCTDQHSCMTASCMPSHIIRTLRRLPSHQVVSLLRQSDNFASSLQAVAQLEADTQQVFQENQQLNKQSNLLNNDVGHCCWSTLSHARRLIFVCHGCDLQKLSVWVIQAWYGVPGVSWTNST